MNLIATGMIMEATINFIKAMKRFDWGALLNCWGLVLYLWLSDALIFWGISMVDAFGCALGLYGLGGMFLL